MTYAEAVAIKAAIEAALLLNAGATAISIGDRSINYGSSAGIRQALAEINRSILAYERRTANRNPTTARAKWVR